MKKLKETLSLFQLRLDAKNHLLLGGLSAVVALILAWYWDSQSPDKTDNDHSPERVEAVDTFIPAGYVLVPIEVANFESLDSILGKYGVVDLFLPTSDLKGRPRKIASRIKILRAPLNPSHFAVLAHESTSQSLVSELGPFTVVVRNPKNAGTEIVNGEAADESKDPSVKSSNSRRGHISRIIVEEPSEEPISNEE